MAISRSPESPGEESTAWGTAKDPTGAVVPGVAITAINVATNQAKIVRTNSERGYLLPNLSLGKYASNEQLVKEWRFK